jgi:hypothetical protein
VTPSPGFGRNLTVGLPYRSITPAVHPRHLPARSALLTRRSASVGAGPCRPGGGSPGTVRSAAAFRKRLTTVTPSVRAGLSQGALASALLAPQARPEH